MNKEKQVQEDKVKDKETPTPVLEKTAEQLCMEKTAEECVRGNSGCINGKDFIEETD